MYLQSQYPTVLHPARCASRTLPEDIWILLFIDLMTLIHSRRIRLPIVSCLCWFPEIQLLPPELDNRGYSTNRWRMNREKSIRIRQAVKGAGRVSGKPAEWETSVILSFLFVTWNLHFTQWINVYILANNRINPWACGELYTFCTSSGDIWLLAIESRKGVGLGMGR